MLDLNGLELRNRFLASAGSLNYGYGYWHERWCTAPGLYGAVVTKTITPEPRVGHYTSKMKPWQVLRKVPGGWMNALGYYNCGIDEVIAGHYPRTKGINLIVSIGAFSLDGFFELIKRLNPLEITGIELNFSCPNVCLDFLQNENLDETFAEIRRLSQHPLILKLSRDADYIDQAKKAEKHGINALHAINTIKGLRLSPKSGKAWLNNRTGGVSGKIIRPFALQVVDELAKAVSIPIIAGGGISNLRDCREFNQVGAEAFSFGSVHILWPWWPTFQIWLSKRMKSGPYWHAF